MTPTATKSDIYEADFKSVLGHKSGSGMAWFDATRKSAWNEFQRLGFPTHRRGNELWKYTNVRPIDQAEFRLNPGGSLTADELKKAAPWDEAWTTLVFVDGRYEASLSHVVERDGLAIGNLAAMGADGHSQIQETLGTLASFEGDAFRALNTALFQDGAYVRVESDSAPAIPVQVLFITTSGAEGRATYPRTLVICGERSKLQLIESYINLADGEQLTVPVFEALLEAGSELRHERIQIEREKSHHIAYVRTRQLEDSTLNSVSIATGPAIGRYDIHTLLDAPGGECTLHGLYLTTNRQHQSNEISTTHSKPHCKSHQYFKGVLSGRSRAVFSGKVVVEPDAQKSEADQKDLNLLLSHGAEIDTKPSLEIYADDVKCGHGATAGHVDPDSMFYMQSRGLSLDQARAMLVTGFAREIVDELETESLRTFADNVIEGLLPSLLAASD